MEPQGLVRLRARLLQDGDRERVGDAVRAVYAVPLHEGLGGRNRVASVLMHGRIRLHETLDRSGFAVPAGAMSLVLSATSRLPLDRGLVSAVRWETQTTNLTSDQDHQPNKY